MITTENKYIKGILKHCSFESLCLILDKWTNYEILALLIALDLYPAERISMLRVATVCSNLEKYQEDK